MSKVYFVIAAALLLSSCSSKIDYTELKNDIQTNQNQFCARYESANGKDKSLKIDSARSYILKVLVENVFPAWYGTDWAFHGTTETPNEGSIACGYFVTTTLRDAGIEVKRVTWAQMASEAMIKEMTTDDRIKRFSNASMETIKKTIKDWGEGLYVVGMDNHTGFIVNYNDEISFVHSSFMLWGGVETQSLDDTSPLTKSKYRVIGKILDDEMVKTWLDCDS
ncbi:MAG: hypothetical protein MRY83_22880 [Flavobacteriales bacterium]|nr:hypothetical protein [Flavobacteriales bacterium]